MGIVIPRALTFVRAFQIDKDLLSLGESVLRKDGAEEVVCFDCVELQFPLSTLNGQISGPH